MRRSYQSSMIETLESRHLLAADLVVEMAAPSSLVPGEFTSYEITVTNNGDEVATATEIVSDPNDLLSDVSWTRETTFKPELDMSYLSRHMVTIEGSGGITDGAGIGDLNNDGIDDMFFFGDNGIASYVVLGSEDTSAAPVLSTRGLDGTNGFALWNVGDRVTDAVSGDINGDGNPDLVFGIPSHNTNENGASEGAVHVIYGSGSVFPNWIDFASLDETARTLITGEVGEGASLAGSGLGESVDIADVNADGIDDIVIAAPGGYAEGPAAQFGASKPNFDAVYVVFGSSDLPSHLSVEELNGANGFSMSGRTFDVATGDINGDGVDDILSSGSSGTALVYGSSTAGDERTEFRLSSETFEDRSEFHVSDSLGDINGDGLDDFVVGTTETSSNGYSRNGAANVIFGFRDAPTLKESTSYRESIGLNGENGFSIVPQGDNLHLGRSVLGPGDFDGDGIVDIFVGQLLIYGKRDFPSEVITNDLTASDGVRLNFGPDVSLDAAGDFNNDGLRDLVVNDGSQARILFGQPRPDLDSTSGQTQVIESLDIQPGTSVTYTVSGTVRSDVAGSVQLTSAATHNDETPNNNTDSQVIRARRNVDLAVSALVMSPTVAADRTVDLEFTVTNDSKLAAVDTVVLSNLTELFEDPTWTRVIEEPKLVTTLADLTADNCVECFSVRDTQRTGFVESAGDVNGDGLADLIVGVLADGQDAAQISIIFGTPDLPDSASLDSVPAVTILGDSSFRPHHGQSAGDVNGDGFDDMLISSDGGSFLIFGAATYNADVLDLQQPDPKTGIWMEQNNVSPMGDRDGDGFDDLTTGNEVSPLILYGSSEFDPKTADATTVVPVWDNSVRSKLTNIGDVNGDGYADSVLTCELFDCLQLFLGNSDRPESIAWDDMKSLRPIGVRPFDVSPIGDVNADGVNDFLVAFSTIHENFSEISSAKVTVFLGSFNVQSEGLESVTIMGETYGEAVAIGDVNADGIDDVPLLRPGVEAPWYRVLIGSADIASLNGTSAVAVDSDSVLRSWDIPRVIGDFNGDGAQDLLVGSLLKLGQFDTTESTGVGNITDTIDIGIGSRVTYRISGVLRSDATDGTLPVSLEVSTGDSRTDIALLDNTATIVFDNSATVVGDVNGDSLVSFEDFLVLSANYRVTNATREDGDLNGDGEVDFADFLLLSNNFGPSER